MGFLSFFSFTFISGRLGVEVKLDVPAIRVAHVAIGSIGGVLDDPVQTNDRTVVGV